MKNATRYQHLRVTIESFFYAFGVTELQYDGQGIQNADILDHAHKIVGEIKHSGEIGNTGQIVRFWKDWKSKLGLPFTNNDTDVVKGFVAVVYGQLRGHVMAHKFPTGWLIMEYPSRWATEFDLACRFMRRHKLAKILHAYRIQGQLEVGFYEFAFSPLSVQNASVVSGNTNECDEGE